MTRLRRSLYGVLSGLLLSVGCQDPTGPPTGEIHVSLTVAGFDFDSAGFAISADGVLLGQVEPDGAASVFRVAAGRVTMRLHGVGGNCTVDGENPRDVDVRPGVSTGVTFRLACVATTGRIDVRTRSTGADVDADGYEVLVDGASGPRIVRPIGVNDSIAITRLFPGEFTVSLRAVFPNCAIRGTATRTITVAAGASHDVVFELGCDALSALQVGVATAGPSPDRDGYVVRVASPFLERLSPVEPSGTVTFTGLAAGAYDVRLIGVAANCDVPAAYPLPIVLGSGQSRTVELAVECSVPREIAFSAHLSRNTDIYVIHTDGTGMSRLTTDPGRDDEPAWSPDGRHIAFRSDRTGIDQIYLMDAAGSDAVRLTGASGRNGSPAWSPDGTRIAFVSDRGAGPHISIMNHDGTNVRHLTDGPDRDTDPAWSPDGTRIAFSRSGVIHVMHADGSSVVRVGPVDGLDIRPSWSPDGSRIAFTREACSAGSWFCAGTIHVMGADGSAPARVAEGSDPSWSRDGRRIAYSATYCGFYYCYPWGIWVVRTDGTDPVALVTDLLTSRPTWR